MGCFNTKFANIQYSRRTEKARMDPSTAQLDNQNSQPIQSLISKITNIIVSQQIQNQHKQTLVLKKLEPHAEGKCIQIAKYFKNQLKLNGANERANNIRECVIISSILVSQGGFYKAFEILDKNQLNNLGVYMQAEDFVTALDSCIRFVENMYLQHGYTIYSSSQVLFKSIITKFLQFSSDDIRQGATQVVIEMLKDNKKLIKLTNQPYYFLQFWLYTINQQSQLDRQLYWIQSVKNLYLSDSNAEDYLFHDSDFKVFIDLLVRVITSCPDGKTLRMPLECYLALTCTKKMQPKPHKIDEVKEYISSINGNSLGLADIFTQIKSLK